MKSHAEATASHETEVLELHASIKDLQAKLVEADQRVRAAEEKLELTHSNAKCEDDTTRADARALESADTPCRGSGSGASGVAYIEYEDVGTTPFLIFAYFLMHKICLSPHTAGLGMSGSRVWDEYVEGRADFMYDLAFQPAKPTAVVLLVQAHIFVCARNNRIGETVHTHWFKC